MAQPASRCGWMGWRRRRRDARENRRRRHSVFEVCWFFRLSHTETSQVQLILDAVFGSADSERGPAQNPHDETDRELRVLMHQFVCMLASCE